MEQRRCCHVGTESGWCGYQPAPNLKWCPAMTTIRHRQSWLFHISPLVNSPSLVEPVETSLSRIIWHMATVLTKRPHKVNYCLCTGVESWRLAFCLLFRKTSDATSRSYWRSVRHRRPLGVFDLTCPRASLPQLVVALWHSQFLREWAQAVSARIIPVTLKCCFP